jgi:hypothetical protein
MVYINLVSRSFNLPLVSWRHGCYYWLRGTGISVEERYLSTLIFLWSCFSLRTVILIRKLYSIKIKGNQSYVELSLTFVHSQFSPKNWADVINAGSRLQLEFENKIYDDIKDFYCMYNNKTMKIAWKMSVSLLFSHPLSAILTTKYMWFMHRTTEQICWLFILVFINP